MAIPPSTFRRRDGPCHRAAPCRDDAGSGGAGSDPQGGVVRLLHYQVIDAVERGALQIFLAAYEAEPAPVHLVHALRGQMPLKMRRFLDFAAPRLRQALGAMTAKREGKVRNTDTSRAVP
jgi:hypothetical protein